MMDLSTKNNHNKQNEEVHQQIVFPSKTASGSFAINTLPRIRAIQRTKQLRPVSYLFQPVDPVQFSSHNNHGICVKVIEYVLETEKRRLTDLTSENTQDANCSEYAPVNYGTITKNNQACITSCLPNMQNTSKPSSIVITHNGVNKKCIPSVPTSKLTPYNQIMYDKSVQIFNFNKNSGPAKPNSNNDQNCFPQISYSTSGQYFSSFAKYTPKQLNTQLIPNQTHFENQKETKYDYRPNYDMQKVPSFQCTNKTKTHVVLYSANSNQPVSLN